MADTVDRYATVLGGKFKGVVFKIVANDYRFLSENDSEQSTL